MEKRSRLAKIVIIFCVFFLIFKTLFSNILFKGATYGMPALIEKGEVDQLFLGSSMFRQGLDIQIINEYFPEKDNYILAYNGNQPIWEYYQLKYLLDNNVYIDKVYLDMYIYSMIEDPQLNDEKLFLEFDIQSKLDLFMCINDSLAFVDIWHLWIGSCNEMLFFWPIYSGVINSQFEDGGSKSDSTGKTRQELENMIIPDLAADINEVQYLYLKKIVELTQRNNIELFCVETPKYVMVEETKQYREKMDLYYSIANQLKIQKLDIRDEFNIRDASNYVDVIHLSKKGRIEFTALVCDAINLFGDKDR